MSIVPHLKQTLSVNASTTTNNHSGLITRLYSLLHEIFCKTNNQTYRSIS